MAGIASKAGKRCGGMRRGICGTHLSGCSKRLQRSIALATDCSLPAVVEEVRANLWGHSVEWSVRHAHASAWAPVALGMRRRAIRHGHRLVRTPRFGTSYNAPARREHNGEPPLVWEIGCGI